MQVRYPVVVAALQPPANGYHLFEMIPTPKKNLYRRPTVAIDVCVTTPPRQLASNFWYALREMVNDASTPMGATSIDPKGIKAVS